MKEKSEYSVRLNRFLVRFRHVRCDDVDDVPTKSRSVRDNEVQKPAGAGVSPLLCGTQAQKKKPCRGLSDDEEEISIISEDTPTNANSPRA